MKLVLLYLMCLNNIKNLNNPSCKNCMYFYSNINYRYSTCKLFGNKNIITDEIIYDLAIETRNNENKCGIKGKYFTKLTSISLYFRNIVNYLNIIVNIITISFLIIIILNHITIKKP